MTDIDVGVSCDVQFAYISFDFFSSFSLHYDARITCDFKLYISGCKTGIVYLKIESIKG